MAELVLYTNPMSRGRIARWMLEEVGAPYSVRTMSYGGDLGSDDYRAVNPMKKIPSIVHGDRVVTECAAICAYLADAFPEAGLAPAAADRHDYYRWLFFAAGPVEAAVTNKSLGVTVSDEQSAMVGYGSFDRMLDGLESAVAGKRFVAGDAFSAADVYIGAQIMWGTQFGTLPKRDAFMAYVGPLLERDGYKRATEKDDALMQGMDAS
jgi:glutathione S-transferase